MGIVFSNNNWENANKKQIIKLKLLTSELYQKQNIVFKDGTAFYILENGKEKIEWIGLPRSFGFFKDQGELAWIGPYYIADYGRKMTTC